MVKAIIYARQSSGDEEQSASVDQQIANCKRLAEDNDLTVVGIYSDLNISGKTYPDTTEAIALAAVDIAYKTWVDSTYLKVKRYRKGLAEVITSLKTIDYVILDDFTRLMRPLPNSYLESHITQKLKMANVKIWCVKGGISDLSNFADNLVSTLISQINANQLEIQRQKSISALKILRDTGYRVCGGSFYGYRQIKSQHYEIEPVGAEAVRKAFEMAENFVPYNRICRTMAEMLGRPHFSKLSLRDILQRPEYAGYQYNSEKELIESQCFKNIPLITLTQFRKVGERIRNRKIPNHDRKDIYAFSGLCFCGYCKEKMIVHCSSAWSENKNFNEKSKFFVCNHNEVRKETNEKCRYSTTRYQYIQKDLCDFTKHKFPVTEKSIEKPVIPTELQSLGLYESLMPLVALPLLEELRRLMSSLKIQEKVQELEVRKRECVDYENKLADMLLRKVIEPGQFETMIKKSNEEKSKISQEIINLMSQVSENREAEIENIKVLLYMLQIKKIDKHLYKKHAQAAIKRILLYYDRVEVELKTGEIVVLNKIAIRNSRVLPDWSMTMEDGKLHVIYYYKSYYNGDRQKGIILDSEKMLIESIGKNPSLSKNI